VSSTFDRRSKNSYPACVPNEISDFIVADGEAILIPTGIPSSEIKSLYDKYDDNGRLNAEVLYVKSWRENFSPGKAATRVEVPEITSV
jgi:hypothetical protein